MSKIIKHCLQDGKEDEFTLDEEYLAFSEGKCYDVYKSSAKYEGLLIDNVRAVFEDDKLVCAAPPCFGFDDDKFQLVPKRALLYFENLPKRRIDGDFQI